MKYWVYLDGKVPGSFEPGELARLVGFSAACLVCPAEGTVSDRNWRRAGTFPDIVTTLEEKPSPAPPAPPQVRPSDFVAQAAAEAKVASPEEILAGTSQRIFRHITDLMRELGSRREEQAFMETLERNMMQLQTELLAARDRIRQLEEEAGRIPGLEDRERKLEEFLERARTESKVKDRKLKDLLREMEETRLQLETLRQAGAQAAQAAEENRKLVVNLEELNRRLAEKELALSRALLLLERLEDELGQILPGSVSDLRRGLGGGRPQGLEPQGLGRQDLRPYAVALAAVTRLGQKEPRPDPMEPESNPMEPRPNPAHSNPSQTASEAPAHPPVPTQGAESAQEPAQQRIPPDPAARHVTLLPGPITLEEGKLRPLVTLDEGKIPNPVPLPPEGILGPMPAPWKMAIRRLKGLWTHKSRS